MWFLYMTSFILIFTFEIIIFQLILRDLMKLSILSNHAEYPKELVLIVIYTTFFYTIISQSKIKL